MIIAGPCLYTDISEREDIHKTACQLHQLSADNDIDIRFRCKLWGGGTTPDKYYKGIGGDGLELLEYINDELLPTGTEIQTYTQASVAGNLDFLWIGARNCQNYTLLKFMKEYPNDVFIKRNPGITISETIGIYDIMNQLYEKQVYIIERGINTFDRLPDSRWSPDLKGVIRIKYERPDIFKRLVVDISHSVGRKEYISDIYSAFMAVGVKHYMVEVMAEPEKSKTDKGQIMSVDELKTMLGGWLIK